MTSAKSTFVYALKSGLRQERGLGEQTCQNKFSQFWVL